MPSPGETGLNLGGQVESFLGAPGAGQKAVSALNAPAVKGAEVKSAREDILKITFTGLAANVLYTTGWQPVRSAPRRVGTLSVSYDVNGICNPVTQQFSYRRSDGTAILPASLGGGAYQVNDEVQSIKYDFVQTRWHNAPCVIHFSAEGSSTGGGGSLDSKGIVWRAQDSNLQGRLLKLLVNNLALAGKADYSSMVPALETFDDAADVLATEVESGAGKDRAGRLFDAVSKSYDRLLADFRDAHRREQNSDAEKAFDSVRKSFYQLDQFMASQVGTGSRSVGAGRAPVR